MAKFAACCVAAGVRRVLQIGKAPNEHGVVPALNAVGIETRQRWIEDKNRPGRIADIQQDTIDLFKTLASDGTLKWPELVYCTDDYMAMAALLSLAHLGVRIPEDIRFATVSNKGHGPIAWLSLARIEYDAVAHGNTIAAAALAYLGGKGFPSGVALSPAYCPGESFPSAER